MKRLRVFLLSVLVFATTGATSANAELINGGFETGDFTGWATIGDARIVSADYGTAPYRGDRMALLTSGIGSVPISEVMRFLGIAEDTWSMLLPRVQPWSRGSAIMSSSMEMLGSYYAAVKSLSNGGFPYSYGWAMIINEQGRWGASGTGASVSELVASDTDFSFESPNWGFPSAGDGRGNIPYTIAFVVVDNGIDFNTTGYGLLVDNVQSRTEPVPEPATIFLIGSGILGLAGFRKKLRR